jgi:hypothetical protein
VREKVSAALRRKLKGLPEAARTGPLAVTALAIAARMDAPDTSERDLAALARELRLVLVALEEDAASGEQGDKVDELRARREVRRASG